MFWEHVLQGQLRYTKNSRYVPTRCEGHVKQAFISLSLATPWLKLNTVVSGFVAAIHVFSHLSTLEDKSWCYSRRVCPSRYYTKPKTELSHPGGESSSWEEILCGAAPDHSCTKNEGNSYLYQYIHICYIVMYGWLGRAITFISCHETCFC